MGDFEEINIKIQDALNSDSESSEILLELIENRISEYVAQCAKDALERNYRQLWIDIPVSPVATDTLEKLTFDGIDVVDWSENFQSTLQGEYDEKIKIEFEKVARIFDKSLDQLNVDWHREYSMGNWYYILDKLEYSRVIRLTHLNDDGEGGYDRVGGLTLPDFHQEITQKIPLYLTSKKIELVTTVAFTGRDRIYDWSGRYTDEDGDAYDIGMTGNFRALSSETEYQPKRDELSKLGTNLRLTYYIQFKARSD